MGYENIPKNVLMRDKPPLTKEVDALLVTRFICTTILSKANHIKSGNKGGENTLIRLGMYYYS
jgi:hypothetical protein